MGYTRIKLCEFESLDAAYESSFLGADYLGFHIFKHQNVEEKTKKFEKIVKLLPEHIGKTLLTDLDIEVLLPILDMGAFDSVQLYPDLSSEKIVELRRRVGRPFKILKVMSAIPSENFTSNNQEFIDRYKGCVDAILLDSYRKGGTGKTANWDNCRDIVKSTELPVFLAGGLTANNVAEAIRTVKPFGVDVETGVSDYHPDGLLIKNMSKCQSFINAVILADRDILKSNSPTDYL